MNKDNNNINNLSNDELKIKDIDLNDINELKNFIKSNKKYKIDDSKINEDDLTSFMEQRNTINEMIKNDVQETSSLRKNNILRNDNINNIVKRVSKLDSKIKNYQFDQDTNSDQDDIEKPHTLQRTHSIHGKSKFRNLVDSTSKDVFEQKYQINLDNDLGSVTSFYKNN